MNKSIVLIIVGIVIFSIGILLLWLVRSPLKEIRQRLFENKYLQYEDLMRDKAKAELLQKVANFSVLLLLVGLFFWGFAISFLFYV